MTKNFDTLLESVLGSLNEAPIAHENPEEIVTKAVQTAKASGKGHWTPVAKMRDEAAMADFIRKVVHRVLPEKNNTYNPDINTKEELKSETLKAIETEMKKSGWAQKFLADRLTNKELLGSVTYELAAGAINNEAPVTQKEINAALKKKEEEMATPEYKKSKFDKEVVSKTPSASTEGFSTKTEYTLEPMSAQTINSLSEEDKNVYDAIVGTGAEESATGREIYDALKRSGITVSQIDNVVNNFIRKGYLTAVEKEAVGLEEPDFEKGGSGEFETIDPEEFGEFGGDFEEDEY
jgi:ribosome-binding protein aMBF1 (putative translation factor)